MRQTPGRRGRRRSGLRRTPGQGSETVERTPLPQRPSDAPPLDPRFGAALDDALRHLGLDLPDPARAAIDAHARLLLAWTQAINLTALRAPDQVAVGHVADSLAAVPLVRRLTGAQRVDSLLDIGSGGGYPGIPLGIALEAGRVGLDDSIAKKARFLRVAADAVSRVLRDAGVAAPTFDVRSERAEALAAGPDRDAWQLVVARAVAPLPELAELALPLTAPGGYAIAWKRDDAGGRLEREIADAVDHIRRLGGELDPRVELVAVPALSDHRLVVIAKTGRTPETFPRTPAERRKQWPRNVSRRC